MTIDDVIAVCEDYGYRRTGPHSDLLAWLRTSLKGAEEDCMEVANLHEELAGERARAEDYKEGYEEARERAHTLAFRVVELEDELRKARNP